MTDILDPPVWRSYPQPVKSIRFTWEAKVTGRVIQKNFPLYALKAITLGSCLEDPGKKEKPDNEKPPHLFPILKEPIRKAEGVSLPPAIPWG
jgi:hypothetical protein